MGDAAGPSQLSVIPSPTRFLGLTTSWHKGYSSWSEQLQIQIHPSDPHGTAGVALSLCTPWPGALTLLVLTRLSLGSPPGDFGIQTVAGACWEHPRAGLCLTGIGYWEPQVEKGTIGERKHHGKQRKNTTTPSVLLPPRAPTSHLHLPGGWDGCCGWALPG